jgi:allophanate hydrolase
MTSETSARSGPVAAVEIAFERIAAVNDNPVWISLVPREQALARARGLEAKGPQGLPLHGKTFAVKDNIDVHGMQTTAGCPAYAYAAGADAAAVAKLIAAGAILIGKTNLDQFATGLVGARSPYGACRNAFDPAYVSGGSSSGSALAVALGMVDFSLGTDTAGSGRVPAAFNNLVGLKPTRGRVSTRGVVPACRSLDCVSIFAKTSSEAAQVLSVIEGFDPADPYSREPGDELPLLAESFRFAVPKPSQREFYGDAQYAALYEQAIARMTAIGGTQVEVDLGPFLAAQALLYEGPWVAERTAQLGEFAAAHPQAVLPVIRSIVDSGRNYTAAQGFAAQYRLAGLRRESEAVWHQADILLVPGAPTIYKVEEVEREPLALNARLGLYTNFVNLLDLAAMTVPAGFREDGIPFGVTLVGPAWSERALAALGARFLAEFASPRATRGLARVAVVGAHLSGMPLNWQLTERRARMVRTARTAPEYRLYALTDQKPPKPGLVRAASDGHGACIEVEIWEMSAAKFGSFVAEIPPPLAIGTLELEDGERVQGFLCEQYATAGREDITSLGGWRAFIRSTNPPPS